MSSFHAPRPELKLPLGQAEAELEARISAGRQLLDEEILRPPSVERDSGAAGRMLARGILRGAKLAGAYADSSVNEVYDRAGEWHLYNCNWLDQNLGGEVAELYKAYPIKLPANPMDWRPSLRKAIEDEVSRLNSIKSRLAEWAPRTTTAYGGKAGMNSAVPDAPIFIVHGRDTLRAERVARAVNKATGRDTIILREQPNLGRTLIEKFEQHATSASYAIVVLTPDDEGGPKGQGHRLRGRQNVVFEMGYFYGVLGRSRVSVLLDPSVEKPSDVDGIAYISFEDNSDWKIELFRELEFAGIHVNISQVP
jgi:predicted nucleotide-binding protein